MQRAAGDLDRFPGRAAFLLRALVYFAIWIGLTLLFNRWSRQQDLGDDPAHSSTAKRSIKRTVATRAAFGPIKLPPEGIERSWRGGFFADMIIYNRDVLASADRLSNRIIGVLLLNSASYLTATVEVNGVTEKIALLDGNCNFRLGDRAKFTLNAVGKSEDWTAQPVDYILRDRDASGKFEHRLFRDEVELFCDPIYFGAQPFTLSFDAHKVALRVEPFERPLGTLSMTSALSDMKAPPPNSAACTARRAAARATVPGRSLRGRGSAGSRGGRAARVRRTCRRIRPRIGTTARSNRGDLRQNRGCSSARGQAVSTRSAW